MSAIPRAPAQAPRSIRDGLVVAAREWFDDPIRPRVKPAVLDAWDELMAAWSGDPELPLLIRKNDNNRGHAVAHTATRRVLVPTDNSPAHWSIALALCEVCPTVSEVRELFASDRVPIAMAIKATEKLGAKYRCTRQSTSGPNQLGWKVAHIENVGLGYSNVITSVPLAQLQAHFVRFLSPRNMFLVPKEYAGVAETPEFRETFGQRERQA